MLNWTSNTIFLLLIIIGLSSVVFYSLYKLRKEQKKNLNKLLYAGEQKYLELADLLPQIVFECDFEGKITFLNKIGKEMFGLNRIDLQNGVIINDIVNEVDRDRFKEDYLYIREGGLNKGQEYFVKTNHNERTPMIFYMSHVVVNDKIEGVRGIIIDMTEQKILERKILSTVIDTEDKERQRFSEDLHDGLGPLLSTIRLYFNQLNMKNLKDADKEPLLKTTYDLIDEAITTTRSIANNILPGTISDNGLLAALNSFSHRVQYTGVISIEIDSNMNERLSPNLEKTLYRIIIELINNTIKHANASRVKLSLFDVNGIIELNYSDNGIGFIEGNAHEGLGLENIKNRCKSIDAEYKITTAPSKGFQMNMSVKKTINSN